MIKTIQKPYYIKANLLTLPDRIKQRRTIYHCCIQKTASQWFDHFWNDERMQHYVGLRYFNPSENFLLPESKSKLKWLPRHCVVSPLFIHYSDFAQLNKPANHQYFFVARDPRDVVVSTYFSVLYSHSSNTHVDSLRTHLKALPKEQGINYFIEQSVNGYFLVLNGWLKAFEASDFGWFQYEDLFGADQFAHFKRLMDYLDIGILDDELKQVLSKNTFENIAGRKKGKEDINHHYRKGTSNDWVNHFTDEHKQKFKTLSGDLLIRLGYENDDQW